MASLLRRFSKSKKQDDNDSKTETAADKIDILLDNYFKLCGVLNYWGEDGEGRFLKYVKDQKPENQPFIEYINGELEVGVGDCAFIECLMDIFPFDEPKNKSRKEIFDVIKYCHTYGRAPLPLCREPKSKSFTLTQHQDHVKVILKIIDAEHPLLEFKQENDDSDEKKNSPDDAVTFLSQLVAAFGQNNVLLRICELIPRLQLEKANKQNTDRENVYKDLKEWCTKCKLYRINNYELRELQKHLFRKIPYSPILVALNAKEDEGKINTPPKPFQLALTLLINTISEKIITEFQGEDPAFICVDLIGIWDKIMYENKMKECDKKYRTDSKKNVDGKAFENSEEYCQHVFGKLFKAIKDNSMKGKYLLQIYLGLYICDGKTAKYPRVCVNIDYVDNKESKWIPKSTYKDLTDPKHPKYAYLLALMHKRYKMGIHNIEYENTKKNKKYHLKKYMMVSFFLFSIKSDDVRGRIFITKMYLNYVAAIMRLHEMDILDVLPRFFEEKHELKLKKKQKNDIAQETRKSKKQFDIDIQFENECLEYIVSKQKKEENNQINKPKLGNTSSV